MKSASVMALLPCLEVHGRLQREANWWRIRDPSSEPECPRSPAKGRRSEDEESTRRPNPSTTGVRAPKPMTRRRASVRFQSGVGRRGWISIRMRPKGLPEVANHAWLITQATRRVREQGAGGERPSPRRFLLRACVRYLGRQAHGLADRERCAARHVGARFPGAASPRTRTCSRSTNRRARPARARTCGEDRKIIRYIHEPDAAGPPTVGRVLSDRARRDCELVDLAGARLLQSDRRDRASRSSPSTITRTALSARSPRRSVADHFFGFAVARRERRRCEAFSRASKIHRAALLRASTTVRVLGGGDATNRRLRIISARLLDTHV
jgi:hypothetical protein